MTINSKAMDELMISHNLHYVKEIGIPMLDIDENLNLKKKMSPYSNLTKKN